MSFIDFFSKSFILILQMFVEMKKQKKSSTTVITVSVAAVLLLLIIILLFSFRDSDTQTAAPYKPAVQPTPSPQTSVKQASPAQTAPAKEVCSTQSIVNQLCSRSTGSDPLNVYYCRNIRECDDHCDKLCGLAGYPKVLSSSGRTQQINLYTSWVYCDCSCEKCVYS